MRHSTPGVVTSVSAHHSNPDLLRVEVAHGRRKKEKKTGEFPSYDDRPSSSLTIPKAHAQHYPVGRSVDVGIQPRTRSGESGYRNTVRNIITGGKKKSAAAAMDDGDGDEC